MRRILLLLCLLPAAGCGGPRPGPAPASGGEVVLDLAAALPAARVDMETAVLEMGRPAARPHLIAGWGEDEANDAGPFVWSVGGESSVEFFAVAPVDLELAFTCRPFVFAGAPEQRVSVALNGEPLGDVLLARDFERYRIDAPASAVARGANRLVFRFAYHRRPRDVVGGTEDDRELAVAWREIAFFGSSAGAPPRLAAGEPGRLELPAGTEIAYYFAVDGPVELAIESLAGSRSGLELVASFRTADSDGETRRFEPDAGAPLRWLLDVDGPAIGRLGLAAAPAGGGGVAGWLRRRLGGEGEDVLALLRPAVRAGGVPEGGAAVAEMRDSAPAPPEDPANVLIYLIDTLRADHLGIYGYPRPTSPDIDRFAADGIVFLDAQAQSSWTRPTVASLFTGLDPRRHGVNRRREALSGEIDTLAEVLQRAGYDTAGFVTNGNVAPSFGFDQGFAVYRYLRESDRTPQQHQLSDQVNAWAFDWLQQRGDGAPPFFLYLHTTDPHAPYVPEERFRSRLAPGVDPEIGLMETLRRTASGDARVDEATRRGLMSLYDAEIAFNDLQFGRLLDRLKEEDLYDSTLIVLLSDHGEEFFDHGTWRHGKTLYGEQLHVPLILKLPGGERAGLRVGTPARQVDVLPTVLAALGMAPPAAIDGVDLLDPSAPAERESFAYLALADRQVRSVAARGWKLILDASPDPHGAPVQLYHLAADRGETAEVAAARPFEGEYLAQLLRLWDLELAGGAAAPSDEIEIPEELRRQLEALGYL